MDQHQRTATLDAFRNGTIAFLAASDVAARGLDIPDVSHIFNYDVPIHPEDYVHRIGRTGRAGREGFAAMLVTPKDVKALKAIERLLRQEIPWIDGQPSADEVARASEERGRPNGRHRRDPGQTAITAAERTLARTDDRTRSAGIVEAARNGRAASLLTRAESAETRAASAKCRSRETSPKFGAQGDTHTFASNASSSSA